MKKQAAQVAEDARPAIWNRYDDFFRVLAKWLPVEQGHWGEFQFKTPIQVSWIVFNESRTKARAEVQCEDWSVYLIYLSPGNDRWHIEQLEKTGEWCQ